MKRFVRLPSPAMLVASTALFVALGGTSYAVATGSIDSREIRNGSIVQQDVKAQGIEGSDIKNGALAARDIKAGSLTADRFAPGQVAVKPRWVFVNDAGQITAQSGGFTVKSAFVGNPAGAAGNVYIDSGEDLSDNAIVASNGLQNARDANADGIMSGRAPGADNNPEFSGEISSIRCAIPGVVTCAPPGTNTSTHFVVSPRNSDGTVTTGADRKPFYVVITG
jgi:hypothetical protein